MFFGSPLLDLLDILASRIVDRTTQESIMEDWSSFPWVAAVCVLLTILWLCTAVCIYRKCFKGNGQRLSASNETPLISPTSENSFLHERIATLNYDKRYEIDRRNILGCGQFGAVYEGTLNVSQQWPSKSNAVWMLPKAFCNHKRQTVAIKTPVQAKIPEVAELVERVMEDELKLMCSVGSHPNIVTLIGAITNNDNFKEINIITEKCNSGTLYSFLAAHKSTFVPQFENNLNRTEMENAYGYITADGKFLRTEVIHPPNYTNRDNDANFSADLSGEISTAHLLSFAMQIAEGMEYLAQNKCLHRDLAARNILLTSEGVCKIADFGLAKRLEYQEYYRTQRLFALPVRWLAVECLRELKFTIEADIWSYGILLYEIFTLAGLPYPNIPGNVSQYVIDGIRNDQPNYCPDAIYHHMTLCWDIDKSKRPSFRDSANLMRKHLSQASNKVMTKVKAETLKEKLRQENLDLLRSQI